MTTVVTSIDYTKTKCFEAKKRKNRSMLEKKLPQAIRYYDEEMSCLLVFSSNIFFNEEEKYNAFINRTNELIKELNELDSPKKIYYKEGEPLLLHRERNALLCLKMDAEVRVHLFDTEKQVTELMLKPLPGQTLWCASVKKLDHLTNALAATIAELPGGHQYQYRIQLLQSKLKELLLMIQRKNTTESYRDEIKSLRAKLKALPSQTDFKTFTRIVLEVDALHSKLVDINKEIGGLERVVKEMSILKKFVQYIEDYNSVLCGWTLTSIMTGAISIGTFFIPSVGIPLTIGPNVVPLIGRFFHKRWINRKYSKLAIEIKNVKMFS